MKLTAIIAALLAVLSLASPADSGSMMMMGVNGSKGAIGPPTFTYQTDDGSWTGAGTTTITSSGISALPAARRVVIMLRVLDNGNSVVSGTIGGVAIDTNIAIGGDGTAALFLVSAVVSSGSTAIAVLNMSQSVFGGPFSTIFTVDNSQLASTTPVTSFSNQTSGTTLTGTVAVLASGSILAICGGSGTSSAPQITSSTAGLSNDGTIGSGYSSGHANGASANAASSVTETWTGTASAALGLAAYR